MVTLLTATTVSTPKSTRKTHLYSVDYRPIQTAEGEAYAIVATTSPWSAKITVIAQTTCEHVASIICDTLASGGHWFIAGESITRAASPRVTWVQN